MPVALQVASYSYITFYYVPRISSLAGHRYMYVTNSSLLMPPLPIASQKQRAPFPRRFIAIITSLLIPACFVIAQLWAVNIISSANHHGLALDHNLRLSSHDHNLRVVKRRNTTLAHPSSPACHPHFKVATSNNNGSTWRTSLPITRIYFYHVRKTGARRGSVLVMLWGIIYWCI